MRRYDFLPMGKAIMGSAADLKREMATLYEQDFYAWIQQQAVLLEAGRLGEIDRENLLEELRSMGKREKRELRNRLAVLMTHLLKWRFQPGLRSRSWSATIREQRKRLELHLEDNPSLRGGLSEAVVNAYELAVLRAEKETGLPGSHFPSSCPWQVEQMLDSGFWPEVE